MITWLLDLWADPYSRGLITGCLLCAALDLLGSLPPVRRLTRRPRALVRWLYVDWWRRPRRKPQRPGQAGFGGELLFQEPPAGLGAQTAAEGPSRVVPRFGEPAPTIYVPEQYVAPLRCSSGQRCGHRELAAGELFYAIPTSSDGSFLVLCSDDVLISTGVWE
jgi:hypothetical protein